MLAQQHRRAADSNPKSTASPTNNNNNSIIDSDAVSNKVNEWIGSFSTWTSSVQKSLESTLTSLKQESNETSTLPTTTTQTKTSNNSKTNKKAAVLNPTNDFIDVDLSSNVLVGNTSNNNNTSLKKSQQPTNQSNSTSSPNNNNNTMMEKRSLIRNQDFSSGEEDEESLIGSLKKGSSLLKASNAGTWFDSTFQNIKTQLFSENNKPIAEEDDGPLAKSFSSKTSSTNPKSPSPVTSTQNNLLDSLSSTFSSLKTQTNDKWSSLSAQFFETQPPIDENDNSFIGKLSKEVDGMVTLSAKQRMYGFFMALGFGLLCILIALGFLPSILFASGAFAFFYTFGNLLCLTSTLFLVGPASQLKNMSKPERAIPSALFVGSMVLTLLCVFFMPLAIFIIILVIVQTISLAWYVVSYIPFAQSILGMVFSSFMKLFN